MITEERIRKFTGEVIGIVETHDNGDKIVRNFPGRQIIGKFKKAYNYTTDFYGHVVAKGDAVVSLLYDARYNPEAKNF